MEIITNQMFENQFMTGVEQNLQSELTDTEQISSGYKVNQPSDDPAALVQIVGYKTQLSDITEYQNAITVAKAPLESLDTSLSTLNNTLQRANELAISAGSGTTDVQSMQAISDELQQLTNTATSIANTNVNGQYIFAGDNSNVNPIDPKTGELISDNSSVNLNIGIGVNVTANVPAGSLFSFARVNGNADSTTAILPTYNWKNNGANTIFDADPVSALETTVPTSPIYTIDPGDSISIGTASYALNVGSAAVAYTSASSFVAQLNAAAPATATGVTFSYDSSINKIEITNNTGAIVPVNWGGTTLNTEEALGFSSPGVQSIGAHATIESDNTIGAFNSSNSIFTTNGGTVSITSGNGKSAVPVAIAANSTLQDVRDDINSANAGVKAQVVNVGTSAAPDFRLVIASEPAGGSANIDISVTSTTDPSGTGLNMLSYNAPGVSNSMTLGTNITNYNYITQASANDSIVIDNGSNDNIANNQIVVQETGYAAQTMSIDPGTYTANQLAADIETNLNKIATADGSGNTYSVSYDTNSEKFKIDQTNAAGVGVNFEWGNANTTAAQLLGFNTATTTNASIQAGGGSVQSDNTVLANYYSFNNNYLNDKYILRALNFEQVSLQNGDDGRAQQAIQYTSDLSAVVSQTQSKIGATEDEVNTESAQQTSSQTDIQGFLANTQDTDLAAVTSDLSLKQTALQALRTITVDVLNQSLFDFIKPA
ncbi:MAG: flagellin hook IN motif-containing protein [Dissulfurispiraceae bacterium]